MVKPDIVNRHGEWLGLLRLTQSAFVFIVLFCFASAEGQTGNPLIVEDFDDHDAFTNLSGNWGEYEESPQYVTATFDSTHYQGDGNDSCKIQPYLGKSLKIERQLMSYM